MGALEGIAWIRSLLVRVSPHRLRALIRSLGSRPLNEFELHAKLLDRVFPGPVNIAVSRVSDELLDRIQEALSDGTIERCDLLSLSDRKVRHLYLKVSAHLDSAEERLARNVTVLTLHRFSALDPLLSEIHREVRAKFAVEIGSPFIIVNSRMWISEPSGEEQGPNAFHKDGFAPGHMKVMIYVSPLSIESGYFEYLEGKDKKALIGLPAGTAVLFRNSDIVHRGVPGTTDARISIELTLMRSVIDSHQAWPGHFYGEYLHDPTIFSQSSQDDATSSFAKGRFLLNDINSGAKVNVGSGRRNWPGWVCLDELSVEGVTSLHFDPKVKFPLSDASASLIYSSHCFEHLDPSTLARIMQEIYRVGSDGSLLLVKIPDYDYFRSLVPSEPEYSTLMDDKGIEPVVGTWKGSIDDTFTNRLAMMFCGYWNQVYGEHFLVSNSSHPESYHGPPKLDYALLQSILNLGSSSEIARELRGFALDDPDFGRFNHQLAWDRSEMTSFLLSHNFELLSTQRNEIAQSFREVIPDISDAQSWSAYYLARHR